ncbi:MAG: hypothetical protein KF854_04660 [Nitrospira sp.]|nr:hypothetical protein [Nitrospira sp.]
MGLVKVERGTDLREQIPAAFTDELAHHNEHALEFQLPFLQDSRPRPGLYHCSDPHGVFGGQSAIRRSGSRSRRFFRQQRRARRHRQIILRRRGLQELAHIGMRYGDSAPPTRLLLSSLHADRPLGCSNMSRIETEENSPSSFERKRPAPHLRLLAVHSMLVDSARKQGRCCGTILGIADPV